MSDQATHLRHLLSVKPPTSRPNGPPVAAGSVVSIAPAKRITAPVHRPRAVTISVKPPPEPLASLNAARLAGPARGLSSAVPQLARAIAICSGKGGVGKSNIAVNLAVAMSQPPAAGGLGLKVCLLDADLGLANDDVLCNLAPQQTLEQVVRGECRLADVMLLAPGGFRLIPGASGVATMSTLPTHHQHVLMEQLAALERVVDVILIDCGAGINPGVLGFASAAHHVVITTMPEPTAITDAYGMIKALRGSAFKERANNATAASSSMQVLVNMVASELEAKAVFHRIDRVSRTFLQHALKFAGGVPCDPAVAQAVRERIPFVLHAPESRATQAVRRLARALAGDAGLVTAAGDWRIADAGLSVPFMPPRHQPGRVSSFFGRLAVRLGIAEYVE